MTNFPVRLRQIDAHVLPDARAAALLVGVPLALLAACRFDPGGVAGIAIGTLGGVAIAALPGYSLLLAMGGDGTRATAGWRAPAWALIVPVSLAIDAILGTLLAIGPGLTRCNLWSALAMFVFAVVAAGATLRWLPRR